MKSAEREDPGQRAGSKLKSAREARGLSIEEAERATNIHANYLEALERGDFEALPRRTWARGFLITYATFLGLQGKALAEGVLPLPRSGRPASYFAHHWRGLTAVGGTLAVAMLTFALVVFAPYNVVSREITDALERIAPGLFLESGPQLVTIVGFDSSGIDGSDNVLAARVNAGGLRVLAIPGDTRITIPGHGGGEIGDAVALGGPDLTRRAVARYMDTEVQHYLMITAEEIREVVDTAGGVTVDVPEPLRGRVTPGGPGIKLAPGQQNLDGYEALLYMQGKDLPSNKARAKRQQEFLYKMFGEAVALDVVASEPATIGAILGKAETNLSVTEALQLLSRIRASSDSDASLSMDVAQDEAENGSSRE